MPRGVYDRGNPATKKLSVKAIRAISLKRTSPSVVQNDPNILQSLRDSVAIEAAKNQSPESMHSTTLEYLRTLRTECAHRLAHFDEIIHMLEQERG